MASDVWIGALLSIPISIAAGLSIRPLEATLSRRTSLAQHRKFREEQNDYYRTLFYLLNPELLTQDLLLAALHALQAIAMIIVGVASPTIAIVLLVLTENARHPRGLLEIIFAMVLLASGAMFNVPGFDSLTAIYTNATNRRQRLRNFQTYFETVADRIRDRQIEDRAIAAHIESHRSSITQQLANR